MSIASATMICLLASGAVAASGPHTLQSAAYLYQAGTEQSVPPNRNRLLVDMVRSGRIWIVQDQLSVKIPIIRDLREDVIKVTPEQGNPFYAFVDQVQCPQN
ncbi:hypothetical protein [Thalassospira sp.]|uniref:hypothetical protein n=1 Tax=Thalassospira sp. TaxID=1912094 RepID=UPI001B0B541E|nr:hypothetical protein [Thalassospira sp.]MBO6805765.1 hypothetical protein [Thalassospira sp.]MBO6841379.1 hypothetical protein [Thalassospira sp.]